MAGKPELSAATGVQNVVVYVSDGNFAQAYAVGQQNVAPFNTQVSHPAIHHGPAGYSSAPHSMATMVGASKSFPDKMQLVKPSDFAANGQVINGIMSQQGANYFTNNAQAVISQNGFSQPCTANIVNNVAGYQNINVNNGAVLNQSNFASAAVKNIVNYGGNNGEVLSGERQAGPGRPELKVREECDNRDSFVGSSSVDSGYVSVMGAEGISQNARCDSVRSETAESSCSSLSSVDESLVVVQPSGSDMVVYDGSVSVRPGGVVLAVGPSTPSHAQNNSVPLIRTGSGTLQHAVIVPFGWKRLLTNGAIIYISPSNAALSSLDQVKDYLLSPGTCKCGLECPLKYDTTFNFDPKVPSKPWTFAPDTNIGDLTKLCNHKRKIMAMATLGYKPPDTSSKFRKDVSVKKKKRKMGGPYSGISVSQILAQREKMSMSQQIINKDCTTGQPFTQQIWPGAPVNNNQQHPINRPYPDSLPNTVSNVHYFKYQDQNLPVNRILTGSSMAVGETGMVQQLQSSPTNISEQHLQQQQMLQENMANYQIHNNFPHGLPQSHLPQQHIFGPNGQVISVQSAVSPNIPQGGHIGNNQVNQLLGNTAMITNGPNGIVIHGQNVIPGQPPPHRIFINNQQNETNGPGRPNMQTLPVVTNIHSNQQKQEMHQRIQQPFCNQPLQYQCVPQQFDHSKNIRMPFVSGANSPAFGNCRSDGPQFSAIVQQSNHTSMQTPVGPVMVNHQQKMSWQNKTLLNVQSNTSVQNQVTLPPTQSPQNAQSSAPNVYERVPPLHQHTPSPSIWTEDVSRKKVKISRSMKKRSYNLMENQHRILHVESQSPCPNIDVRQIPSENNRTVVISQSPQSSQGSASPSFMEDPSGYLAQQTALLNSTISRQTGANSCAGFICNSPVTSVQNGQIQAVSSSQPNEVPLPSNVLVSHIKQSQNLSNRSNQNSQNMGLMKASHQVSQSIDVDSQYHQINMARGPADSTAPNDHMQCQGCIADSMNFQQKLGNSEHSNQFHNNEQMHVTIFQQNNSRPSSQPSSTNILDDPVTSSTYSEKHSSAGNSPDSRPIQGGTVSTSNVSPADGSQSNPSTPNPHTPTPPHSRQIDTSQINIHIPNSSSPYTISRTSQASYNTHGHHLSRELPHSVAYQSVPTSRMESYNSLLHAGNHYITSPRINSTQSLLHCGIVTTMASGRTFGSNTITSVLAGRANTSTVSVNNATNLPVTTSASAITSQTNSFISAGSVPSAVTISISKSPLEMVQSVVSSIQVPHTQHNIINAGLQQHNQQVSPVQVVKHSPTQGLPPGHILVSSGGQLIIASTSNGQPGVMPPPPPKIVSNQTSMPPISVSPMVSNVTAAVTQVIPAVAQQVLGQQTVLVNALPSPFVLQPGVTMTMDGMTVGQNMQIPQLVTGNVIQQQLQVDGSDPNRIMGRTSALLSPESKKKGKKRKMSSQTIASMLHIASQQNSGVVMSQQGFPQQIQMAHSPQGIATGPVMQALTIVPGKAGGPPQIVVNGQHVANASQFGTQPIITNSQQTQQINLLQPVNLLNGATGMVQNFPAIQQFIVPNLGGMVMNADGTATILQDTSNLGMQLQLQNVNGQNVLTPVQNNNMFNGGQSILAAGPAGMVIRTPSVPQNKIIQQQHSPGAQFLSPNGNQFVVNSAQFGGQLSPLVANVSPTQQVTFSTAPQPIRSNSSVQQTQQEFIQCGQMGQTLMVPTGNINSSTSNQQNTTFVQQNTTIVQQQTTMVSNNQPLQNIQTNNPQSNAQNIGNKNLNVEQNFVINPNDNRSPVQALLLQRQSPQISGSCRHSVSTQTAVNQNNTQTVTTNTFCQTSVASAGSPPDTTTHSPMAPEGQSPPTADTTTHSGSTDDGLSPASNCSGSCSDVGTLQAKQQSCSMAMVHCITSSEPDSADLNIQSSDSDWSQSQQKSDFAEITSMGGQIHITKKSSNPIHMAYAESSTMVSGVRFVADHLKSQEAIVSSRNFEKSVNKRKHGDTLVVMENRLIHPSLYDDDEENGKEESNSPHSFVTGDLVWGPAKGRPAWPGKLMEVCNEKVLVRWFGGDKSLTKIDACTLQTLTEGLDAHHRARKNCRKSRKLDAQLEKAIEDAMAELDKKSEAKANLEEPVESGTTSDAEAVTQIILKKTMGRLRSSQR